MARKNRERGEKTAYRRNTLGGSPSDFTSFFTFATNETSVGLRMQLKAISDQITWAIEWKRFSYYLHKQTYRQQRRFADETIWGLHAGSRIFITRERAADALSLQAPPRIEINLFISLARVFLFLDSFPSFYSIFFFQRTLLYFHPFYPSFVSSFHSPVPSSAFALPQFAILPALPSYTA